MAQLVVVEDHGVEPPSSEVLQPCLGGLEQRVADSSTPPGRMHRKTVEMGAPPVPPSDDGSDQLAILLGYEQGFRIPGKQRIDNLAVVGGPARVLRSDEPEGEECFDIIGGSCPH